MTGIDAQTEAEAVAQIAWAGTDPNELDVDKVYSLVVPRGADAKTLDLEKFQNNPRRKTGSVKFYDAESFSAYVNLHKGDATQLYRNDIAVDMPTITAFLNDHSSDSAGWQDHTATLLMERTKAWKAWRAINRKLLDQSDFAEHIEEHIEDIAEPSGALMLEIAQSFQAKTNVEFRSGTRLQDGQQQLTYNQETTASAGSQGEMVIPTHITLGIAPFEGSDAFRLEARLRYRISDGSLKLGIILNKADEMVRAAFQDVTAKVEEGTDLTTLFGRLEK